jgi:pyridoxine 4-dehydrogenase
VTAGPGTDAGWREHGGIGLSNITPGHLRRALAITDIACVQHLLNLADRRSMPVLEECHAHGIAFVPFFPLKGSKPRPSCLTASDLGNGRGAGIL